MWIVLRGIRSILRGLYTYYIYFIFSWWKYFAFRLKISDDKMIANKSKLFRFHAKDHIWFFEILDENLVDALERS